MDWSDLLRSVVLAATISAVVAGIGFWVSAATALRINKDRIGLEKALADQRFSAELTLAVRKVELDRELALSSRRAEIAEAVLADFYRIKKAFEAIRSPLIWAGEMVAEDVVRNDGYGVIRRIRFYADQLSKLEATRFTFGALFGHAATVPYDTITRFHNHVFHAA